MIQWGWFYILFNYSHQILRILPETILVRMQIIGKISSFVRHKIESADVIDAESLDLFCDKLVAFPKIAHTLFFLATRDPDRRDRVDLALLVGLLDVADVEEELLDHFVLSGKMVDVVRSVGDDDGVGVEITVGEGRSVKICTADALNYAVGVESHRGAPSVGKRVYARIPALRDAVADEKDLCVELMARCDGTVRKLKLVDNSDLVRGEGDGHAAGILELDANVRVGYVALINAVDEVFETFAAFVLKCDKRAVGLKIEPDSRGRLRAEAENVGKRVKGVDLTLLHLVKADAVILLFDIDRADG